MKIRGSVGPLLLVLLLCGIGLARSEAAPRRQGQANAKAKAKAKAKTKSAAKGDPRAALITHGIAAREAGELVTARKLLTEAYRARPAPELLRELGLLARAEQRPLEAHDLLRRYLAETEGAANASADPARVEIQRFVMNPVLPSGRLLVLGEPGGLVSIDGRIVGVLPLSAPLLVSTDEHKLLVEQRAVQAEAQVQVPALRMAEVRVGQPGSRALLVEILPAVLFLPEYAEPKSAELEAQAIEAGFGAALEAGHATMLPVGTALEFTGAKRLASCLREISCQTELARLCALDHALQARIEKQEAGGFRVQLQLVDAGVGDVAASSTQTCEGCDARRLVRMLAEATTALLAQANARPRGQLEIRSEPPDAEVVLDGRVLGRTPFTSAAWIGAHALLVRRAGSEPEQRQLVVSEGQTTSVRVVLTALPQSTAPPPPPPVKLRRVVRTQILPRPRWRLVVGSLALGGGAVLLGIGGRGLALSGSCTTAPSAADAECNQLYDTTALGAGLVGAGGALAIGGVVLLALPGERRRIEQMVR